MFVRRIFFAVAALLGLSAVAPSLAHAATEYPFTQQAFNDAQTAGKPILVHVWASWCPTCKAQGPTLSQIEADPARKDLVVFKVDFDAQKDVVRNFGVRMQSTLIAFAGATETARSTGDTNPASIKTLVGKAYR
ncbi:MAG: thioredoxin family protein [Acetobacteraceae bacterium]|nr:thioredoxin family protein [Acetobacteraceae bacterium]